jgi:hypothetical protein
MKTPRSVYLARLRRAFLLRVHPDRFRCASIRSGQSHLVKSLASRLSQADFTSWQQHGRIAPPPFSSPNEEKTLSYVLEQRDGSLLRTSLSLDVSVDSILKSMASALRQVGAAASLPEAPEEDEEPVMTHTAPFPSAHPSWGGETPRTPPMSRRGRDLFRFLSSYGGNEIEERKASRMDAQASALTVRSVYGFAAVDATSLGWSSAWVAVLLRRLLALHDEHAETKFRVRSFYPIRLQFTNAAVVTACDASKLDLYGGVLKLSPAATSIQWLETLQMVTEGTIEEIQHCQARILEYSKHLQGSLGVKLKKGHSCSNQEYYSFLEELWKLSTTNTVDGQEVGNALMTEMTIATVESSEACRRPMVTSEGSIRLGAGMAVDQVVSAISRLGPQARERRSEHERQLQRCKEVVHQAQWQLGLQRVYRTGSLVSQEEFLDCLVRLLAAAAETPSEQETKRVLQMGLGGNSLGIAGTGQFCHLADDGSLVIPHNWQ